jgi:hypothetical protein
MKVEMSPGNCQVIREKGDPRFSGILYAKGESRLLHHLKVILNKRGYDLIKKRMTKDGHLVDSMQQYLRTRKPSGDPNKDLYIYNSMWAIQGADEDFRRRGSVSLRVESNVFNPRQGARHAH